VIIPNYTEQSQVYFQKILMVVKLNGLISEEAFLGQ